MVGPGISQKPALSGLPSELLLIICGFLTPLDLTCFSLCDRRIYEIYREYYSRLPDFTLTGAGRSSLLVRLERDLPEYFFCHICDKLHWYDGSEDFGLSGLITEERKLPCVYREFYREANCHSTMRTHTHSMHPKSRLSNLQVKLAMRRFQYGSRSGISTDSLSYTQVRSYLHPIRPRPTSTNFPNEPLWGATRAPPIWENVTTLFSIEALICPDPLGLYVRLQDILVYKYWEDSKIQLGVNPIGFYEICPHQTLLSKRNDLDQLKEGKMKYLDYACSKCTVECKIEISPIFGYFGFRVALVMTRWFNLGKGLDRNDPLWLVQAYGSITERLEDPRNLKNSRLCFEGEASESFDKLRDRNLSYLKWGRYMIGYPFIKDYWHFSLWYTPYRDPSNRPSTKRELLKYWWFGM